MSEDDWKCEHCGATNKLRVGDLESCKCAKCGAKNANIEEMLYILGNQQYQAAE